MAEASSAAAAPSAASPPSPQNAARQGTARLACGCAAKHYTSGLGPGFALPAPYERAPVTVVGADGSATPAVEPPPPDALSPRVQRARAVTALGAGPHRASAPVASRAGRAAAAPAAAAPAARPVPGVYPNAIDSVACAQHDPHGVRCDGRRAFRYVALAFACGCVRVEHHFVPLCVHQWRQCAPCAAARPERAAALVVRPYAQMTKRARDFVVEGVRLE